MAGSPAASASPRVDVSSRRRPGQALHRKAGPPSFQLSACARPSRSSPGHGIGDRRQIERPFRRQGARCGKSARTAVVAAATLAEAAVVVQPAGLALMQPPARCARPARQTPADKTLFCNGRIVAGADATITSLRGAATPAVPGAGEPSVRSEATIAGRPNRRDRPPIYSTLTRPVPLAGNRGYPRLLRYVDDAVAMIGPRSLTRTTMERPLLMLVTRA